MIPKYSSGHGEMVCRNLTTKRISTAIVANWHASLKFLIVFFTRREQTLGKSGAGAMLIDCGGIIFPHTESAMATNPEPSSAEELFTKRSVKVGRSSFDFHVFVPGPGRFCPKNPVLLYLHGGGLEGRGSLHLQSGLPALIQDFPAFPYLTILPVCAEGYFGFYGEMEKLAMGAMENVLSEFGIAEGKACLTGWSAGASACWFLGIKHPHRFRAILPVSGAITWPEERPLPPNFPKGDIELFRSAFCESQNTSFIASRIKANGVWLFHGSEDSVCPCVDSDRMAVELHRVHPNVRYSRYEGDGHYVWRKAYVEPLLWSWLIEATAG
jgi:predicted peptidase